MPTIEIRIEVRQEGPDVVARLIDPTGNVGAIELGRGRTRIFDSYPAVFQSWKEHVQVAARAVIEDIVKGIPEAKIMGFSEVSPGEPTIPDVERN